MKIFLILFLSAILVNATVGVEEPKPTPRFEPGNDYALAILENARVSMNGPVRALSHPQNGWVRIEYIPRQRIRVEPGALPGKPPAKRRVWLNVTQIVTLQDWDAATRDREARNAGRARQ